MPHDTDIVPTDSDVSQILKCINMRLGSAAIEKSKLNSNSQKAEATNRAFSRTNPKTVTMARNMPARIHSAVSIVNDWFSNHKRF